MGSTVRNGFSTLNRLLGKKNKDSSLSKSNTNLSHGHSVSSQSLSNSGALDTSSLHNKIVPLPAASSNAPFEQTFRITICLPRDQLYVVRVGARTKLAQLLETVCASKQLDATRFEFRHPDGTQTYDLGMTIGEVGLNEIRLADKTDKTYIKFSADDIMRLRHLSRESLTSSSDFSKGSARQYSNKTVSPYSSTNSLNSMDSATGLNQRNHNNNINHNNNNNINSNIGTSRQHPPVAPQRKKRIAPRPPSQIVTASEVAAANEGTVATAFKKPAAPLALPRKAFHVSTPNLNGNNTKETGAEVRASNGAGVVVNSRPATAVAGVQLRNGHSNGDLTLGNGGGADRLNRQTYAAGSTPYLGVQQEQQQQRSRTSSDCSGETGEGGELPTPRKRTFISAARKKAPAPPPRLQINASESTTIIEEVITPKVTTTTTSPPFTPQANNNISKVMLNVEQPPPAAAPSPQIIELDSRDLPSFAGRTDRDDSQSLDSHTTGNMAADTIASASTASSAAASSDEEETKIYNIKTGKPIVSSATNTTTTTISSPAVVTSPPPTPTDSPSVPPASVYHKSLTILRDTSEPSTPRPESPLWTYPLPAPLKFADTSGSEAGGASASERSDVPIKAVITQRAPLDFESFTSTSEQSSTLAADEVPAPTAASITKELPVGEAAVTKVPAANTSDAEDGYQGYSQRFSREALLESLERRRELFIEQEFEFLRDEPDDVAPASPGVTTKATTVLDHRTDVMAELKDVLQNEGRDTLISSSAVVGDIAGNSTLSNFKIQAYSTTGAVIGVQSEGNETKDPKHREDEPAVDQLEKAPVEKRIIESDAAAPATSHFNAVRRPSGQSTDGGSLTSHNRVNRSDSFHSTQQGQSAGLTQRSSSYISLIGVQKYEPRTSFSASSSILDATTATAYRRSSSSELSIADAPSLQSLSVLKSILSNSRKNSVCAAENTATLEETAADAKPLALQQQQQSTTAPEPSPASPAARSNVTITQLNGSPEQTASKEVEPLREKKWRYQGPPSINVSTWGERPRSCVSIKTDTDYKFGGQPLSAGATPPVEVTTAPTISQAKPTFQAPPATAPSAPVTVNVRPDPVPASATQPATAAVAADCSDRVPIIRGVVPKVSTTFIGGPRDQSSASVVTTNSAGSLLIRRRPSYEISTYVAEKPAAQAQAIGDATPPPIGSTMTLGRVPIPNRWSAQPANSGAANHTVTVKTFKVADPVSTAAAMMAGTGAASASSGVGGHLLRGGATNYAIAKDGSFDSGYKSMPPVYSEFNAKLSAAEAAAAEADRRPAAPFSQFTLRKTGLKDKILADSTARQTGAMQQEAAKATATAAATAATTTTVLLRSTAAGGGSVRPFSVPAFVAAAPAGGGGQSAVPLAAKMTSATAAPVTTATAAASAVTLPPPPPPAPLGPAALVGQRANRKTLPPPEAEPRDQLLDAIRNFSKQNLKKK